MCWWKFGQRRKTADIFLHFLPEAAGRWWCFCPPSHRQEEKNRPLPWRCPSSAPSAGNGVYCLERLPLWTWSALCAKLGPQWFNPSTISDVLNGRGVSFSGRWAANVFDVADHVDIFSRCVQLQVMVCAFVFHVPTLSLLFTAITAFICQWRSRGIRMTRCPSRGIPVLAGSGWAVATWRVSVTVSSLKGSFHLNFPFTNRPLSSTMEDKRDGNINDIYWFYALFPHVFLNLVC